MTMKRITLTIANIERLNSIEKQLSEPQSLSTNDQTFLAEFLSQIPSTNAFLIEKVPFNENIAVSLWTTSRIQDNLQKWKTIFSKLPGWDYCPFCYIVDRNNPDLLQKNVIMVAVFAPSMAHNL